MDSVAHEPGKDHSVLHASQSDAAGPALSKNAAKKLARRQKYEATKLERRAAERLKKKVNKRARWQEQREMASATSDSKAGKVRAGLDEDAVIQPKTFFNAKLVVDCGFEELMNDKELSSFVQQLMYLYSANRHARHPFAEIILTGAGEQSCLKYLTADQHAVIPPESTDAIRPTAQASMHQSRVGEAMNGKLRGVWKRWKGVTIYEQGGLDRLISHAASPVSRNSPVFVNDVQAAGRIHVKDVIYLTADTDNVLSDLEEGKTYVIGGIVDKNRYKALCKTKADQLGIRMAKLPLTSEILDAVEIKLAEDSGRGSGVYTGRKVLTVNQVVEILLGWTETSDWVQALAKSLPQRKYVATESCTEPA